MKNVGILDGDLVVVQRQETARDGEIIVALVEEEATVKRFFREGDHIRLQPENDEMDPILGRSDVSVVGTRGRVDAQHVALRRRYAGWRRLSSRGGVEPSRKVRTSQGEVVGNADPGKPAGKCHRNDTA